MIALLLGTVITLAALAFVLYPLFATPAPAAAPHAQSDQDAREADARTQQLLQALREVEFDRATGKLSGQDYEELKAAYTRDALIAMREEEATTAAHARLPSDEELEAVISRYRTQKPGGTGAAIPGAAIPGATGCPTCGPRPEHDAAYCSSCGRFLAAACPACAAPVPEPGARFCSTCGTPLGAIPPLSSATH